MVSFVGPEQCCPGFRYWTYVCRHPGQESIPWQHRCDESYMRLIPTRVRIVLLCKVFPTKRFVSAAMEHAGVCAPNSLPGAERMGGRHSQSLPPGAGHLNASSWAGVGRRFGAPPPFQPSQPGGDPVRHVRDLCAEDDGCSGQRAGRVQGRD